MVTEQLGFDAINLRLEGWTAVHADSQRRQWMRDAEGDEFASTLLLTYQPEALEGIDLDDHVGVRKAVRDIADGAGQIMVSVDVVGAAGVPALWYILKQNQAPSGMVYSGCLILPFTNSFFTLQLMCMETGITGIREAIVMDRFIASGVSIRELSESATRFEHGTAKGHYSPDAPEHDVQFPNHPLSKVRRYFRDILSVLSIKGVY